MDPLASLVLSIMWLAVVAGLIIRATRRRQCLPQLVPRGPPGADTAAFVAVVVPARDEAANIGPCLRSLLAQDYPAGRYVVVVVDDHSTDGTPDIVARLARREPRLRLVLSPRLPPNWTGKSHACWIGARTIGTVADWICFVDADMRAEPNLLTAAMEAAQADRIDLLSVTPRQVLGSFAERLIIPNGLFILAFLQGVASQPAGDGGDVTATGQFMLVRAERYAAVGGHAAVRSAICEDLELARRCRRAGGKVRLADGAVLLCGRMYTGWRTLWPGFAKNLVDMFGGPGATAATALISIMLAWAAPLVPALALWACIDDPGRISVLSLVCAALASAAMWSLHVAGAIYFRIPAWFGLLFPLGYTLGAVIAADSMRRRWQGRVTWKGRVYS